MPASVVSSVLVNGDNVSLLTGAALTVLGVRRG